MVFVRNCEAALAFSYSSAEVHKPRLTREQIMEVVDNGAHLPQFDRAGTLKQLYDILDAKVTERLLIGGSLEKLIADTLSITKLVAWLGEEWHPRGTHYDNCLYFLAKVAHLAKQGKRNIAILYANYAKILSLRLDHRRNRSLDKSYDTVDPDKRKRKEIYDHYQIAINSGASNIVHLETAKLILEQGYSPSGDKTRDREEASDLLSVFDSDKGGKVELILRPLHHNSSNGYRDTSHRLPHAGSSKVRAEALRVWELLSNSPESSENSAVVLSDPLNIESEVSPPIVDQAAPIVAPPIVDGSTLPHTVPLLQLQVNGDLSAVPIGIESTGVPVIQPIINPPTSSGAVNGGTSSASKKKKRRIEDDDDSVVDDGESSSDSGNIDDKSGKKKSPKKITQSVSGLLEEARRLGAGYRERHRLSL